MKKRVAATLIILSLVAMLLPMNSRAAISPYYFTAINDKLMPFTTDNMPYINGGEILVPTEVLKGLGVFTFGSNNLELVYLYRGLDKIIKIDTASGVTEDMDGNKLSWPTALRRSGRIYVPLEQICNYFDLTYDIFKVPLDTIASEQMRIIRIISSASINQPTFLSLNKNALRTAYDEYYTQTTPPQPPIIGVSPTPTPTVEPPPSFSDVTIHLSFYDVSEESVDGILDLLDIQASLGYQSCFFVSADDIRENPGLIRRISGVGHTIGILLTEGTYAEYLEASELLFEAAKVKTVLVLADGLIMTDTTMVDKYGLIFWESSHSLVNYEEQLIENITATISQERNARQNLLFSCSENATSILPGIISYLRENSYTIERITETVAPEQ